MPSTEEIEAIRNKIRAEADANTAVKLAERLRKGYTGELPPVKGHTETTYLCKVARQAKPEEFMFYKKNIFRRSDVPITVLLQFVNMFLGIKEEPEPAFKKEERVTEDNELLKTVKEMQLTLERLTRLVVRITEEL